MRRLKITLSMVFLLLIAVSGMTAMPTQAMAADPVYECQPTHPDLEGPFYKPGAPVRASVGKGYLLTGKVLSARDCKPVSKARIELWQTGPHGDYDDDHRATLFSEKSGQYMFESNLPPGYSGRPPHIHMRISADGFKTLTTQHYPEKGKTTSKFNLILIPLE